MTEQARSELARKSGIVGLLRAHARHEHDAMPEPACRACQKFGSVYGPPNPSVTVENGALRFGITSPDGDEASVLVSVEEALRFSRDLINRAYEAERS